MRKKIVGLMIIAVMLFTAGLVWAQSLATPEAAVKAYMALLQKEKINEFVAVMHPGALADFKKMMMPVVKLATAKKKEAQVMTLFKGVKNAALLEKMPPAQVFAAFYKGLLVVMPKLSDALAGSKMEVLGHVAEGKELAHVVYRATMSLGQIKSVKVDVVSCRLYKGKWMVLLSSNLEGLAAQIKMQIENSLSR